jgi:Rho GDP-dissociation inhibitor
MGSDHDEKETGQTSEVGGEKEERHEPLSRHASESSVYATEEEEDEYGSKIQLGPPCSLKEHLEKDKVLILIKLNIALFLLVYI